MALKGMAAPPHLPPPWTTTSLEVTVVSGESVRLGSGRALRRGAYAVVRTASSSAATRVDEADDCCGYPFWDEPVRVELPAGARGVDVEICRGRAGGGRGESVAAARVPVEDFTVGPPGHLHCLSYRLHDAGDLRRRNGIVNLIVKRLGREGQEPVQQGKPPLPVAAMGKAVDDAGASGSGSGSSCGVGDQGKPVAGPPVAGAVMGYPVGMSATASGHADGKGCV